MGEALREGGLYYIGDKAVDAFGVEVKDAPKRPKDTPPPPAGAALTQEERLAVAIATALKGGGPRKAAVAEVADEELPTIADLPDYLAELETKGEVKAMQRRDERAGAVRHYEARLAELDE